MALGDIRIKTGSSYSGSVILNDLGALEINGANVDIILSDMFDIDRIKHSEDLANALTGGTGSTDLWVEDYTKSDTNPVKITTASDLKNIAYGIKLNSNGGLTINTSGELETTSNLQQLHNLTFTNNKLLYTDSNSQLSLGDPGQTTGTQPYSDALFSIAGLTTSGDEMIYTTGTDSYATLTTTSFGRSLLNESDASSLRNTLNVYSKPEVDELLNGISWKKPVRVATTNALPSCSASGSGVGKTLTADNPGELIIDGITTELGDRILVKDQANAVDNGIYEVTTEGTSTTAWVLTRATDADGSPSSEINAAAVFVMEGNTNQDTAWVLTTDEPIVDTTPLEFVQFSNVTNVYTASEGIKLVGNDFSLDFDNLNEGSTDVTNGSKFAYFHDNDGEHKYMLWTKLVGNLAGEGLGVEGNPSRLYLCMSEFPDISSVDSNFYLWVYDSSTGYENKRITSTNFINSFISTNNGISLDSSNKLKLDINNLLNTNTITSNDLLAFYKDSDSTHYNISFSDFESNLNINNIGGTLSETNGGTGQTSYTTGDILYASNTDTLDKLPIGSNGQVLTVNNGLPSWQNPIDNTIRVQTMYASLPKKTIEPIFFNGPGNLPTNKIPFVINENGYLKSLSVYTNDIINTTSAIKVYVNNVATTLEVVYSNENGSKITNLGTGSGIPVSAGDRISIKLESTNIIDYTSAVVTIANVDY